MGERFVIDRKGCDLAGERWPGNAPLVVLLHEGVSDRRGWRAVAQRLRPRVTAVAYDRRGYGESAVSTAPLCAGLDLLELRPWGTERMIRARLFRAARHAEVAFVRVGTAAGHLLGRALCVLAGALT